MCFSHKKLTKCCLEESCLPSFLLQLLYFCEHHGWAHLLGPVCCDWLASLCSCKRPGSSEIDWELIPETEILVVFDADMVAKKHFFVRILEPLTNPKYALCLSPQVSPCPHVPSLASSRPLCLL